VKTAGGMAQVEESLPSEHELLISNPSTTKKKDQMQIKIDIDKLYIDICFI
jgi:hypothetical protein